MEYDCIIVGAGVIGCSTAYHLKRALPQGRILLLDKNNTAGAGNTAKSAALYRNVFSSSTSRALAGSSIHFYRELGDTIKLNPIGYLWLFSKDQWEAVTMTVQRPNAAEDGFDILDNAGITNMVRIHQKPSGPFRDIYAGIHCHLCGSLSAMGLARYYSREFERMGGEIRFDTEIVSFELQGSTSCFAPWDDVRLLTIKDKNGNTYRGEQFIITTGSWTHDLLAPLGIASGILPKKRQLFGLKLKSQTRVYTSEHRIPAIILPSGGVYIKPIPEKNILVVGCADDLGQPFMMSDPKPNPDYFHMAIKPVLFHYFPQLQEYELAIAWAGYYAYHWPDMNPVIESVSNITWASGTSGSGIMKADAIGRITAAKLQGLEEAHLADETLFTVDNLSLRKRNIEQEELVI